MVSGISVSPGFDRVGINRLVWKKVYARLTLLPIGECKPLGHTIWGSDPKVENRLIWVVSVYLLSAGAAKNDAPFYGYWWDIRPKGLSCGRQHPADVCERENFSFQFELLVLLASTGRSVV